MSFSTRALGLGIAAAAALTPLAATSAQAAPADAHVTQAKCGNDVCMYTGKNFTGKKWGYNHYKNRCLTYDHAIKIRSLKIPSSKGTTFWSKPGCKGTPSMSFKGNISVKDYTFTARSSR